MLPKNREWDTLVCLLWHSIRWTLVRLAFGHSCTVQRAVSLNGVQGEPEGNAALRDDLLQDLCGLSNARHAARHFVLGRPRDVPQAVLAHILARRLVNVDLEYPGFEGCCSCCYMRGEEATTSCIHGAMVDSCTASPITRVQHISSARVPRHRRVRLHVAPENAN